MKKLTYIITLFLMVKSSSGQNGCFNNINTRTTDPNEYNATDGKNPNALNINGIANPNRFDWTDPSVKTWYWHVNPAIPSGTIVLPYYCVSGNNNINGSCANQNTYYYQQLINNFPSGISLHDKNKLFDILPEDGWELLYKSFGTPSSPEKQPTFILYNKYTAKLKVFAAATGLEASYSNITGANRAALSIKFPNSDKTALFGLAQPITQVLSAYTVSPVQSDSHYMSNEFCTPNSISHLNPATITTPLSLSTQPEYQWLMSEFNVPYDPCTCFSGNIPELEVAIIYWSNSNISLSGKITGSFNAVPDPYYNGSNLVQNGNKVSTKGNVLNSLEGAFNTYETWSGYSEKVKKMLETQSGGSNTSIGASNIQINNLANVYYSGVNGTSATNISQSTSFLFNSLGGQTGSADDGAKKLAGLVSLASNIASASPYVAAFIGFMDLYYGGGQTNSADNPQHVIIDNPPPPTNYDVSLKVELQGQISSQAKPTQVYPFVPGSRSSYNLTAQAPSYNNILGVFNILQEPTFDRTPIYLNPSVNNNINWPPFQSNECWSGNILPYNIPDYVNTNFGPHQFRITSTPAYLLNPASNLKMEGIDAAIVLEYDKNAIFSDLSNLTSLNTQSMVPFYNGINSVSGNSFETKLNTMLSNSGMDLEFISKDFQGTNIASDAIIRFRTKYVPYECLGNQSFILYGNPTSTNFLPKCYLKLVCKLSVLNNPNADPITIVQTFDITNSFKNATLQTQFMNAGNTINVTPTSVTKVSSCISFQGGCNQSPACVFGWDIRYDAASYNVSLNAIPFPNTFFSGSNNINPSYITSSSNIVIQNDVPLGFIYVSGNNISFSTPNTNHIIGTALNAGTNGNVAKIYAANDITFNGSFNFINTNDIRAGHEISIPNTSEVDINGETRLLIDNSGSIVSHMLGCNSPAPISNLEASSTNINNMCGVQGALRPSRSLDSTETTGNSSPIQPNLDTTIPNILYNERISDFDFSIVPNPTNGMILVSMKNATEYPKSISVTNLLSTTLLQINSPESFENKLDITNLPNGMYVIKIEYKGMTFSKRIIKN